MLVLYFFQGCPDAGWSSTIRIRILHNNHNRAWQLLLDYFNKRTPPVKADSRAE